MLPQIILLNGTGSAGKTSLAKELIEMLNVQYLNFSIDSVLYSLPNSDLQKMQEGKAITREGYHYPTLVEGYHQAAKGLANAGCNLILDNAWSTDKEKLDILNTLKDFEVCLVGVKCHLLVAALREKERGDRALGLAESEYNLVHQNLRYDIEIDTTQLTPTAVAKQLLTYLKGQPSLTGAKESHAILNVLSRATVA
ncbi:chloramphenicol phosphotransferase CPT family protein [Enterovibrio sp. ZSDZ35]|uniref:Chloramphenicol phosphotransferase CPT family protein n=1 Tax=Enterovibrio qingdaonensis TaxID=2899818 RepID=A0ABT5QGI6_9GAMM|nr:zeta toxin family protein [Enterovibrio sp. ZSDZ35]MDD1780081.1 chloramphenicol phosphotransferase CPT family protein [Enterovibrio sp. ZSDZ35]